MNLLDGAALQTWLGRTVRWRGQIYQVVEILDDGPALVLESPPAQHHIQTDAHGRPRREARDTVLIPVLSSDGGALHEDFAALKAGNT